MFKFFEEVGYSADLAVMQPEYGTRSSYRRPNVPMLPNAQLQLMAIADA
jgi:hypothetical protein